MLVNHALELGPDFLVHFAGHGADGLPYLQQLVECAGGIVPLLGAFGTFFCQLGSLVDKSLFGEEVVVKFLLALVVVFLAAFVNLVGGVAEALPNLLVLFGGHRTDLFPAGAQILHAFECLGDGSLHDELFGSFAEFDFLFEVALLVEGAEFAVDF